MSSIGHSHYLLVCAASEGPLAGLFKVGMAVSFPLRYSQHWQTWGAFDLPRCALVCNLGHREARKPESALRAAFGNPDAEVAARLIESSALVQNE